MLIIRPSVVTDAGAFTRSSIATYFTPSGLLATATTNEPRYNFEPDDLTIPPVLLLEDASTNLLTKSAEIDAWTLTETTVSANSQTSPTGAINADRLLASAVNTANHYASKTAAPVAAGAQIGASIFLHSGGVIYSKVQCLDLTSGDGFEAVVNLLTGQIESSTTIGAGATLINVGIQKLPGNWYRLGLAGYVAGATDYTLRPFVGNGTDAFIGDGVSGVDLYGGQIEPGEVTSFILTTTATASRAVDVNTSNMLSNVPETDPVYSIATTYAKDATVRGAGVDAHIQYISLQNGNLNKPLSDPLWWLKTGSTNPWRMFDQSVNSQTNMTGFIAANIRTVGRIDSVVLLNVSAARVRVTMVDAIDGTVYDKTFDLISTAGIDDWYDYFFEPIVRANDIAILDLPAYANSVITVTLSDPGFSVTCGACIVGLATNLGLTQYGARVGIQDYSVKQRDEFGNFTVLERAFSKRGAFQVYIPSGMVDQTQTLMETFRATPIVYIGSELYASTMIYGFYKEFDQEIQYKDYTLCTLEIEGLT